ncbi:MAG: dynamin family protein [Desulfobacterales bacterium]|nr:dynamin family protein [Desulfobacterales bacterium]
MAHPTHPMVNETYERFRAELAETLKSFQALAGRLGNAELADVISDLRAHVSEPVLFVVVGEIKAGKSSFINALLGKEVCAVDPAPCTDVIQQIVYAPEPFESDINDHVKRIGLPVDILNQIAIVDTPGTNTVIAHHQEITERFIPNASLVLFVFPAKNPHTRSAWELLEVVTEAWRKRVIFVLQQADLATDRELAVNLEKVKEYATERGVDHPKVFVTSAVLEAAGDPRSGFAAMRTFIHDTVTGGRHFSLKLRSTVDTCDPILDRVSRELDRFRQELAEDSAAVEEIDARLAAGRRQADRDGRFIVDRLLERYDAAAAELRIEFESRLSAPTLFQKALGSVFRRKASASAWVEDLQRRFETRLVADFEDVADAWSGLFNDTLKDLTETVMQTLERIASAPEGTDRLLDLGREKESMVSGIRKKVAQQAGEDFFATALSVDSAAMGSHLVGGGALTLVGAILLATTHVAFLDITGGILTGAGLFLAGGTLVFKRGRILKDLDQGLAEGRARFEGQLTQKLVDSLVAIFEKIGRSVSPLVDYVADRQAQIGPLAQETERIRTRLAELSEAIDRETKG